MNEGLKFHVIYLKETKAWYLSDISCELLA